MKKIIVIVVFFTALSQVHAQEKYLYLNLDLTTPLSNTEWLKSTGKGAKIGYRVFINERFSAGADFGWAFYNQYFPKTTFEYPTGALTTDYFNYLNTYSLTASGQYHFAVNSEIFFPYAGIGLGAMSTEYTQYYNIYEETDRSWGFLARPEAGVLIRLSKRRSVGGMVAVHYDYSTNTSEANNYSNFTSFGVQFGLMFMDW